ncbi:MAG: glutamine-hydrolyzing GMP synthase [Candidatus Hadarchaeota archaeon]
MDLIIVLDFGGQYAHLIGRRIREQKVYSKVIPCNTSKNEIINLSDGYNLKGLVLSGGPSEVYSKNAPDIDNDILDLDVPILGICYGHQLLAKKIGGEIVEAEKSEYGIVEVGIKRTKGILKDLPKKIKGWTSHRDIVKELPEEYETLASTKNCPIASYSGGKKRIYGIQWHPEVTHTDYGEKVFKNFLFDICNCEPNWEMDEFIEEKVEEIKREARSRNCIIGVSGGIDSTTSAVLASRALGKKLTAVFVDHGLLRKGEAQEVKETLNRYDLNLIALNERERFFKKLKGVTDPERKRKIIGEEFIRIFEREAEKADADYLIQGTIYPDWIESGSEAHSETIKSHHNVGGIPSEIEFRDIIEPLRDLYKDEVREVARSLGIPDEIVERQPFPGPGLAVRLIGEVTDSKIDILKRADKIFREEVEGTSLEKNLWQYFAVLLSTKSTGVKGDARDYGHTVALRAVQSDEAMTANFAKIPYDFLEKISKKITNQIPEVTRVVYDITHKPPATIEWE